MDILVIGNGFDLDHGLPTKYKDFLDFINRIKSLVNSTNYPYNDKSNFEGTLKSDEIDINVQKFLLNDEIYRKRLDNPIIKELFDLANKNAWINYLEKIKFASKNKRWIDFKSEISYVIRSLDYMKKYRNEEKVQKEIKVNKDRDAVNIENEISSIIGNLSVRMQNFLKLIIRN